LGTVLRENRLFVIEETEAVDAQPALAASLEASRRELAEVWETVWREIAETEQSAASSRYKRVPGRVTVAAAYEVNEQLELTRQRRPMTLRQLRLVGAYGDVLRALAALSRSQGRAVPIAIGLEPAGLGVLGGSARVWLLTVKM
jgi:hypothetical protein